MCLTRFEHFKNKSNISDGDDGVHLITFKPNSSKDSRETENASREIAFMQ